MSISRSDKLRPLINQWEPATVVTSKHLKALGITPQHVQKYLASGWFESLAPGVLKRPNEHLAWMGALYSLQTQLGLKVHVGGLTALEAEGFNHYIRLSASKAYLYSAPPTDLPGWFMSHDFSEQVVHIQTKFLPVDLGLTETTIKGFNLTAATPERAVLELLYLAPLRFDLVEAYQIVESLRTLRPKLMQALLEACTSIKVTRLFLHMAERAELPISPHLNVAKLHLGTGDRTLVKDGAYAKKYKLILPKELASHAT